MTPTPQPQEAVIPSDGAVDKTPETWDIAADPACPKRGDGFSINETEAALWK